MTLTNVYCQNMFRSSLESTEGDAVCGSATNSAGVQTNSADPADPSNPEGRAARGKSIIREGREEGR